MGTVEVTPQMGDQAADFLPQLVLQNRWKADYGAQKAGMTVA